MLFAGYGRRETILFFWELNSKNISELRASSQLLRLGCWCIIQWVECHRLDEELVHGILARRVNHCLVLVCIPWFRKRGRERTGLIDRQRDVPLGSVLGACAGELQLAYGARDLNLAVDAFRTEDIFTVDIA
jgi:hypothetical protein